MSTIDVAATLQAFQAALAEAHTPAALEEVRRTYTGKKSPLKAAMKDLRSVPPEDRRAFAQQLNETQDQIEALLTAATEAAEARALAARLETEHMDLTLPGIAPRRGARHPLTEVEQRCLSVMRRLGFTLVDGPEVETAYYNFDALNIPEHHPARDMQDTFWVPTDHRQRHF